MNHEALFTPLGKRFRELEDKEHFACQCDTCSKHLANAKYNFYVNKAREEKEDADFETAYRNYCKGQALCTCSDITNYWSAQVIKAWKKRNYTPAQRPYKDQHLKRCMIWDEFQGPPNPCNVQPAGVAGDEREYVFMFQTPEKGVRQTYPVVKK